MLLQAQLTKQRGKKKNKLNKQMVSDAPPDRALYKYSYHGNLLIVYYTSRIRSKSIILKQQYLVLGSLFLVLGTSYVVLE